MGGGFIPEEEDVREKANRPGKGVLPPVVGRGIRRDRVGTGEGGMVATGTGTIGTGVQTDENHGNGRREQQLKQRLHSRCTECASGVPCTDLYAAYGIYVCGACRKDLKLISKSNAKQQYLLTDSDLRSLKWMERKNPQRSSWTAMKLYLESDVERVSYGKYGGREGVEGEARRRVGKKLDTRVRAREEKARKEERRVRRVRELREEMEEAAGVGVEGVDGDEEEI